MVFWRLIIFQRFYLQFDYFASEELCQEYNQLRNLILWRQDMSHF